MDHGEGQYGSRGASYAWAVGKVSMGLGEHYGLWGLSIQVQGSVMGHGECQYRSRGVSWVMWWKVSMGLEEHHG